jgi:exodeoxyribonuclease V alpha subunit
MAANGGRFTQAKGNEILTGKVLNISRSFRNGFRTADVRVMNGVDETSDIMKVVGVLPEMTFGDIYTFIGCIKDHPTYGRQFCADQATVSIPKDEQGFRNYLTRTYKWVGPHIADELCRLYKPDEILSIFENHPERLTGIKGITPERAQSIQAEHAKVKEDYQLDLFFSTYGITLNMMNRLIDTFGTKTDAVDQIKANPYSLAELVWGVGFKKADAIAVAMGIKKESRRRISAGIKWLLLDASESKGHCYLPRHELIRDAVELLGVSNDAAGQMIDTALAEGKLILERIPKDERGSKPSSAASHKKNVITIHNVLDDQLATELEFHGEREGDMIEAIYHPDLWAAEKRVAAKICQLLRNTESLDITPDEHVTSEDLSLLDEDQRHALELSVKHRVVVITGFPGTGKSHIMKTIIKALGSKRKIELASPTGKAAKRMNEATGIEAKTIHRLLAFNPMSGFQINASNPLRSDTLIIDEQSMTDISLMDSLMDAVRPDQQVIFIGDIDQLPSVGPGAVLHDLINCGKVPVARLTILHRQSARSLINLNAQRINRGEKIEIDNEGSIDFQFIEEEDKLKIPGLISSICQSIPDKFGISMEEVIVLCPQKIGDIGTIAMNKVLQPVFNPHGEEYRDFGFRKNDRVIQLRNNYKLDVFNGDVGFIRGTGTGLESDSKTLLVEMDNGQISYPQSCADELQLAYALSVHKSQGSQYLAVVMPIHTTNFLMLRRNLIYTGITRGKKLVVLVGTTKAINTAIRTQDTNKRHTGLRRFIQSEFCKNGN